MSCIPNLFVIGAPKCGTTALVEALSRHPEIYVPKKEIRYFDARTFYDFPEDAQVRTLDQYLRYFDSNSAARSRYRVDGSVFNMYAASSLQDILALNANAKFVLTLRDPLDAAKSMHMQRLKYHDLRMREVSESFADCWKLLDERRVGRGFPPGCRNRFLFRYDLLYDYGLYLPHIEQLVPARNLALIDYADLVRRPGETLEALWRFLGVERHPISMSRENNSYVVEPNFLSKLSERFVRRSAPLRHALAAAGLPINRIGRAMISKRSAPPAQSRASDVDAIASAEFSGSAAAMADTLSKYSVMKWAT
ncbi:sulfotransferase [Spectribacter hydrogenoxidans]|uniref:Sulfotransferase n=1 Tax=Spectribacter hydrogenoxidans TaxID=3075608 RepID=A0ABU3C491_9GAMM|nr:sulfotransferase [Salinisphaera sp. W335]MDT0636365.1 sulfotransferase [Salinisphaera sp. W335]